MLHHSMPLLRCELDEISLLLRHPHRIASNSADCCFNSTTRAAARRINNNKMLNVAHEFHIFSKFSLHLFRSFSATHSPHSSPLLTRASRFGFVCVLQSKCPSLRFFSTVEIFTATPTRLNTTKASLELAFFIALDSSAQR